jgi:hypothetical protein
MEIALADAARLVVLTKLQLDRAFPRVWEIAFDYVRRQL